MRIFPVLLISLIIFHAGLACAEEEPDIQPDGQALVNTTNTLPPPPTDEYNNVPPAMLMTEDDTPAPELQDSELTEADVMTMDEIVSAYDRGHYDVVAKHLFPIAKNNYPQAEELLGIMYYKGQGVPQEYETAIQWLTKAAEAGRPLAEHYLATLTYAGNGTMADPVTALMWLYISVVHCPEGSPEKARALQDRTNLAARLSRRDRLRAFEMAHDWLKKKDETALFDDEEAPAQ